ncbi:MAG: carbonic anhydrase family protein [Candidatus Scalindua sp.]|jgi:carbonic anhydrase|nr:carbonic anhydrase family protein [Candidatus Scalindua sp.]MDV5166575.1 carbonic anhydrase family protein [Candidatus Scalindua sp.]
MKRLTYAVFLAILLTTACNTDKIISSGTTVKNSGQIEDLDAKSHDFSAKHKHGFVLPGLDHGLIQSPINILTNTVEHVENRTINVRYKDEVDSIANLGHTIQLHFTEGSTISAHGKTFHFKQMHFHTPSEHQLDGITYPMEMHIVNAAEDKENNETEYLVVSILFRMGGVNKFISDFHDLIPEEKHSTHNIQTGRVRLSDLLMVARKDKSEEGLYYYKGSLTTPPYTESVNWYIDKHIYEASPEQIETLKEYEGNNARRVQEIQGRIVEDS